MKLIINADDAGVDVSRNAGIFKAIDQGAVSSVSVLVGLGGWDDLLMRLSKKKFSATGLHLNLTAGKPMSKNAKTLIDAEGNFYNKFELFKRSQEGLIDSKEIESEFLAQKKMFEDAGLKYSHIDGHNHVHLLSGAREVLPKIFPKGTKVRLPVEIPHLGVDPRAFEVMEIYNNVENLIAVTNFLCAKAKEIWKDHFRYVDDFGGSRIADCPTFGAFRQAVEHLKGDFCELMCHPGDTPDENSVRFSKFPQRQDELKILTSPEFKGFLKEKNAELASYLGVK